MDLPENFPTVPTGGKNVCIWKVWMGKKWKWNVNSKMSNMKCGCSLQSKTLSKQTHKKRSSLHPLHGLISRRRCTTLSSYSHNNNVVIRIKSRANARWTFRIRFDVLNRHLRENILKVLVWMILPWGRAYKLLLRTANLTKMSPQSTFMLLFFFLNDLLKKYLIKKKKEKKDVITKRI